MLQGVRNFWFARWNRALNWNEQRNTVKLFSKKSEENGVILWNPSWFEHFQELRFLFIWSISKYFRKELKILGVIQIRSHASRCTTFQISLHNFVQRGPTCAANPLTFTIAFGRSDLEHWCEERHTKPLGLIFRWTYEFGIFSLVLTFWSVQYLPNHSIESDTFK